MAVTKRTKGAASTDASSASPSTASSPRRLHKPVAPADDEWIAPAYVHKSPVLLLGGFVVAFSVVLYCAFVFWQIKAAQVAARDLASRISGLQSVRQRQEELNAHTRHKWELYAEHRGNVSATLLSLLDALEAQGNAEPSLAVLGAGNMNDLDLARLVRATPEEVSEAADASQSQPSRGFSSLALVDLDADSMTRALARHQTDHGFPSERIARLRMYAADLSGGSLGVWDQWKKDKIAAAAADSAPAAASASPALIPSVAAMDQWISQTLQLASPSSSFQRSKGLPPAPARFSAVLSLCLLSQLLDSYMSAVAENHPSFLAGALALREAHLRAVVDLLEPAGWGVLVTDIVASTTFGALRTTAHVALPSLLPALIESSNFFTGCNPRAIEAQIKAKFSRDLVGSSIRVREAPWSWRIGGAEDKTFLVYAIVFQKKP